MIGAPRAYTGPFPIRGRTMEDVMRHEAAVRLPRARAEKRCYLCSLPGVLGCEHFAPAEPVS